MYLALKINVIFNYMCILYKCLAQNVYIKSKLQKVHTFIFSLRSTISDTCLRQGYKMENSRGSIEISISRLPRVKGTESK